MAKMPPPIRQDDNVRRSSVSGPGACGVDSPTDHDRAHQKRQQRRQHQVVHLERQPHGEHADKMHSPDRHSERNGGTGEQKTPPRPRRARNLQGEA